MMEATVIATRRTLVALGAASDPERKTQNCQSEIQISLGQFCALPFKIVPCNGILDSTKWIPDSRYWIPVFVSGTWTP